MSHRFILGTANFGLKYGIANKRQLNQQETFTILKSAQKLKVWAIDTAKGYFKSEEIIGNYLKEYKTSFKIISGEYPECNSKNLRQSFFDSLRKLHQDSIYGYLIHNFQNYLRDKNIWSILKRLKLENRIKKIGFSLYLPSQLDYLLKNSIDFDLVQLPYNIFDQRFRDYFFILRQKNIEVFVRSVFMQGLFFIKLDNLGIEFLEIKNRIEKIQKLAKNSQLSISCLAMLFVMSESNIDAIIIGVDSSQQLIKNLQCIKKIRIFENIKPILNTLRVNEENILLPYNWKKNDNEKNR